MPGPLRRLSSLPLVIVVMTSMACLSTAGTDPPAIAPPIPDREAGADATAEVAPPPPPPPLTKAPLADGRYRLHPQKGLECLDVVAESRDDGALLQRAACSGADAQLFDVQRVDGDYRRITNVVSGKSLDVKDKSVIAGAPLQQWTYVGNANQQFAIEPQDDGSYAVRARHDDEVLESADDGTPSIRQWTFSGDARQRWTFELASAPPAPTAGFVHASGATLLDGSGKRLLLRTIDVGNWLVPEGYMWGFEGGRGDRPRHIEARIEELIGVDRARAFWLAYRDAFATEADVAEMAKLGFNSARLAMSARLLMPEGGDAFDEVEFKRLADFVTWCRKYGIYAILDMHTAPGGQTGKNIDDSATDYPELYTVASNQDRLVRLWTEIARRFSGESSIAGYDLLNEPLPSDFSSLDDKLWPIYQRVGAAIRTVDRNHPLIVEGANWANDWSALHAPFDENMIYSFHKYWNTNDQGSIQQYVDARAAWNRPVWVGETGENDDGWYRDAIALLEKNDLGWGFWPWKKLEGGNNPYGAHAPGTWWAIQNYVKDATQKPTADVAQKALDELVVNVQLSKCAYNQHVVCAILPCK